MGQVKGRRHPDNSWPDDMPPGDFFFLTALDPSGERTDQPKRVIFACPRGKGDCQVPIRPNRNANGASWSWDGNRDAPTLAPSINCHHCGWHGWLRNGVFEGV
jgi:hypothetical protein